MTRRARCAIVRTIATIAISALLFSSSDGLLLAASTKIKAQADKTFSFAGLTKWAWHPEGPGDVRMALTADDNPEKVAARINPIIIPAMQRELTSRKLLETSADLADLHVHYYALVTLGGYSQEKGQFLAPTPQWGVPPFSVSTTALEVYPSGTLILDLTAPKTGAIVWRGQATRTLDLTSPDDARRKALEYAIHELIVRIPKK